MFAPVFESAAEQHPDVVFAKINTETEQELAQTFGIMSISTLMVFRHQVVLYSQPGALPAASLKDLIGQAGVVDMDKVHRTIAERAAQSA